MFILDSRRSLSSPRPTKMKTCAALFFFALSMLSPPAQDRQNRTLKDDLGYSFQMSSPPQRIVSLAPNITEILFAVGLGNKVVGVTRFCDYPPQALLKEKVGGMVDPSLEKIKSLNPDLIIAFRGNPIRMLTRLKSLGFPVFIFEAGSDLESLFLMIERVGLLTQRTTEANSLVSALRQKTEAIQAQLPSATLRPRVFISLHGPGLWTCGKESYLNDLILKAKGENVAGTIPKKWLRYNREQLLRDNPEVIVVLAKSQADYKTAKDWLVKEADLRDLEAVRRGQIHFLDENLASRYGPRLVEALGQLARLLHPRHFGELR
jgi:cobalamin transport system substrate-binding protein